MSGFQSYLHLGFDVTTAPRERRAARGAAPRPEERFKEIAESSRAGGAENIPEIAVLDPDAFPGRPSWRRSEIGARLPTRAELVIAFALFGVGENLVGLADFLELLFRRFVVGVYVGVVFAREFAVRLLDLIRGRDARNSQSLVIVVKLYRHIGGSGEWGMGSGGEEISLSPASHSPFPTPHSPLPCYFATCTRAGRNTSPSQRYPRRVSSVTAPGSNAIPALLAPASIAPTASCSMGLNCWPTLSIGVTPCALSASANRL